MEIALKLVDLPAVEIAADGELEAGLGFGGVDPFGRARLGGAERQQTAATVDPSVSHRPSP